MNLWDKAKLSLEQSQNTTRPGPKQCWARSGGVIGVKVWVQFRVEYGGGSSSECVLCAKPLDEPLGRSQIVFGAEPKTPPAQGQVLGALLRACHWGQSLGPV